MDINKALRSVVSTGKVYFGIKEAKKVLKAGQAKLVIISSNCPKNYIEELKEAIEEKYGECGTDYCPVFLEKAAWEIKTSTNEG